MSDLTDEDRKSLEGAAVFCSMSGGKDSTAAALWLRERGIEFTPIFADTGWEHPDTYAYLDSLEQHFGPIERVGRHGGFRQLVRDRHGFPGRVRRFCTSELKRIPLAKRMHELASGRSVVSVTGMRRAESRARAKLEAWEVTDTLIPGKWSRDGVAYHTIERSWRPLLHWQLPDVVEIHQRHGVLPNPLYLRGFGRVGCFPCIMVGKEELKRTADEHPEIIDEIEAMEVELTASAKARIGDVRLRSMFAEETGVLHADGRRQCAPVPVRRRVEWARTVRGGGPANARPRRPQRRRRMRNLGPLRAHQREVGGLM